MVVDSGVHLDRTARIAGDCSGRNQRLSGAAVRVASSIAGQWVATVLAVASSGVGIAGVALFWATGDSQPIAVPWHLPGAEFSVAVDGLSAIFLLPVFLISLLGSIYGLGYWKQTEHPQNGRKLRLFYGLLAAGMATWLSPATAFCSCSAGRSWRCRRSSWSRPRTTRRKFARRVGSTWWRRTWRRCVCLPSVCVVAMPPADHSRSCLCRTAASVRRHGQRHLSAGLGRIRPQGRHHAAARLAAERSHGRAQPRVGHHVGRHHQDGNLRTVSDHVAAADAAARLGRRRARRSGPSRESSESRLQSASTTSSGCWLTTASRISASSCWVLAWH